jgi:hypothetical protein
LSPKDGPRDWDKELAQIDKLIGQGGAEAPAPVPAQRGKGASAPAGLAAPAPAAGRKPHTSLTTWLRLLLALLLGAGMTQWPYTHGCGIPLLGYLVAVGTVIIASFWSMVSSWRSRSGLAHFLSIGLLFWGTFLGAREVLPRVGYAKDTATWFCAERPAPRAPAPRPTSPSTTPQGF